MPSADRLHEFVAVVDAGSISAAARALDLPRPTLSRRLTALEEELGIRLLHRETRRLTLTHAGTALLERARCVVEDTRAAWASVARLDSIPRGRLRVSMPPTAPFHELLLSFAARYPAVEFEIAASPRIVDLQAEKIDVAMRFGPQLDPNLVVRKLWSDRSSVVATPAYLDRQGRPEQPEQLADHECLLTFTGDRRRANRWPLRSGGSVQVAGHLWCDEVPLHLDACLRGMGLALLPDPLTQPYRTAGRLEAVLPEVVGTVAMASLVYPEREFLPPQVRAFVDHTVEFYAEGLAIDPALLPPIESATLDR